MTSQVLEYSKYLRLKILTLEYQNMLLRLEQTKIKTDAAFKVELAKFGLDPNKDYLLKDSTCEAVEVAAPKAAPTAEPEAGLVDATTTDEVAADEVAIPRIDL